MCCCTVLQQGYLFVHGLYPHDEGLVPEVDIKRDQHNFAVLVCTHTVTAHAVLTNHQSHLMWLSSLLQTASLCQSDYLKVISSWIAMLLNKIIQNIFLQEENGITNECFALRKIRDSHFLLHCKQHCKILSSLHSMVKSLIFSDAWKNIHVYLIYLCQ